MYLFILRKQSIKFKSLAKVVLNALCGIYVVRKYQKSLAARYLAWNEVFHFRVIAIYPYFRHRILLFQFHSNLYIIFDKSRLSKSRSQPGVLLQSRLDSQLYWTSRRVNPTETQLHLGGQDFTQSPFQNLHQLILTQSKILSQSCGSYCFGAGGRCSMLYCGVLSK